MKYKEQKHFTSKKFDKSNVTDKIEWLASIKHGKEAGHFDGTE